MTHPLALTGERTVPGVRHENYWFRRHEAAYAAVSGWVSAAPRVALDAGCGEGYGAAALAAALGCAVVGVDYDAVAVAHAARSYAADRTAYVRGGLTALPLASSSVDVAVSLQVLEHIWQPEQLVRELARVCRPGSAVVLSTPNRLTFSPGLGRRERPDNLFHCREYDADELVSELQRWAPELVVEQVLGVRHGDVLRGWEQRHGSIVAAQQAAEPAAWSPGLAAAVAAVAAGDFELTDTGLAQCLDLVVVARARPASRGVRQTATS